MAIDSNFLAFLVPAALALVVAALALPGKARVERDPSTAYRRGRRALVNIASLFALVMGLVLTLLGGTQELETVVDGLNMVHIGGISLIVMAAVLLVASSGIRRQVKQAGRGAEEIVLDVAAVRRAPAPMGGAPPPAQGPPRLAQRPPPPYADQRPPPSRRPPPQYADQPPRRDLPPRPSPPPRDGRVPPPPRVERSPPPPRHPPPE